MTRKCAVSGCKARKVDCYIDILEREGEEVYTARCWFCNKHFDIIMPYIEKKEKEECAKNQFWAFAPLKYVNEALEGQK